MSRQAKLLQFEAPGKAWTPVESWRKLRVARRPATPGPVCAATQRKKQQEKSVSPSPQKTAVASGGMYPTITVSDAFNTACHAWAAHHALACGELEAALGFGIVAAASGVGTARFGLSEDAFAQANGDLAHLAAFLGLPLVGLGFVQHLPQNDFLPGEITADQRLIAVVVASVVGSATLGLADNAAEAAKIIFNVGCFVLPILAVASHFENTAAGCGVVVFAIGGVVVGPDRHRYILGMRRENWFHYMIGLAALLIATGLCDVAALSMP